MAPHSDDLTTRIDELEAKLAGDPSPGVFAPLAEAYRLSGRLDSALETARRGVAAHPNHAGIRVVLARAVADSEGDDRALPAYRDVLELDADNLEALAFIEAARQSTEAGTEDQATRDTAQAAAVPPEGAADGGHNTGAGSLSEELAHLADLFAPVHKDTGEPTLAPASIATLTLAEIYSRQGLHDKAAEVCERILERDPDNAEARSALEEYRRQPTSA